MTTKIAQLETLHKVSLGKQSTAKLLEARQNLQDLLELKAKCSLFFKKIIYFEHRDKGGKYLATALKEASLSSNILVIKSEEGTLRHHTDKIVASFQKYYSKLYNIPQKHKLTDPQGDRKQIIYDHLIQSDIPTLSTEDVESLKTPIPLSAIKSLKPG